ncbi:MAG: PAS domain S-box protein [Syntrophaceae bacterium]|nr:PAS domain S-box protein [Syntrophaceae bacterium]
MIKTIERSLRLKWMLFSILLATIPLAIAGLRTVQIYQGDLKKSLIEMEEAKANIVVETAQAFLEKAVSHLLFLARSPNFENGGFLHIRGHLENLLYQDDYFMELILLDEKGRERIRASKYKIVDPSHRRDLSKTEMFRLASKGQVYYGGVHVSADDIPSMVIAVPVQVYKGKAVGVLAGQVHLQYLWDVVSKTRIGEEGFVSITDREGTLIAHPDTRRVWMKENVSYLCANRCHIQKESVFEWKWPSGERFLNIYRRIKGLDWGVIVQVPVEEAYAPLRQVASTAVKWIMIALTIAVLFSLFLTHRLTLPIKRLTRGMGEVAKGNLDAYIEPYTKDELGTLTESFNQMIRDLKLSHEALEKAEEKYRRIFEDSKDMLYITSIDGRIVDVNQSGMDLFGYGSKEEMLKVYVNDTFLRPEDQERFWDEIKREGSVKDFEARLKRKDGTPIDVLITVSVRRDESGNIVSYEGTIKDISDRKRMEEELLLRADELQALHHMSILINQTLDLDRLFPIALERVLNLMGFEMGAFFLWYEERGTLELKFSKGYSPSLVEGLSSLKSGEGIAGKALELGKPILLSVDEYPLPRVLPFLKESGIQTLVGIPLLTREKPVGAITLTSRSVRRLNQREIRLVESIGNQIGLALENARLFEESKRRLDELTILYEIMSLSASSLNLDEMLKEIITSLDKFFKFEALGILLVEESTKRLLPHPASYKELTLKNIGKLGLCVGKGITGWVAEKGQPLLVNDVREDRRYIPGDEDILSEMCVPLKVGEKVIGVIDAQSRQLHAFSKDSFRLLNIVARQISSLIENVRLREEIKQSEERYRTVVESALDGICVIGRDYRIQYVNEKLTEIHGCNREELIGADFRDSLDEESKGLLAQREDQRGRGIELSPYFELNILRKDGGMRRVEVSARDIRDSKGDESTIAIFKDVTDKKRMEEELLQGEKLRALGEMASGVAHDFNNALAAILGNTQLLLHTVKDEDVKASLKVIEKVAQNGAKTVKRLQEFARKRVHQELFEIDANDVIRDAIEITRPRWRDEAQAKGIQIEMASDLEGTVPVVGDPSELREVIASMIFNAVEAMPEGGRIEIQTSQTEGKVYIQISDTGVGIPEEAKKKIFEPFFTTKPFSNPGLGLSMCYGVIKRFGGEIEVESIVGHGTTFTIILPKGPGRKEGPVAPAPPQKGRAARILVIDDEETVRNILSHILVQMNHQVSAAKDGEEGIRLFKEREFDLVLTDLGMPGISGWEVGKSVKKISPQTPVGMITGWGLELDHARMKESGIDFVISKPFQFDQILRAVDQALASKGKTAVS